MHAGKTRFDLSDTIHAATPHYPRIKASRSGYVISYIHTKHKLHYSHPHMKVPDIAGFITKCCTAKCHGSEVEMQMTLLQF
jgi:hypothetical protein